MSVVKSEGRQIYLGPEALDLGNDLDGHGVKQLGGGVMLQHCKRPERVCQLLRLESLYGQDGLCGCSAHELLARVVSEGSKCPQRI